MDTEKLKSTELDLLREFIKICEENSLEYFMVGGTALGAVRHKGFIPWDDDIDVAMPREDYEKFLSVSAGGGSLPSTMFLQSYKTDKNYPNIFAKIRKSDTTFIEKTVSRIDMNHGVYIDIFPLDGYSECKPIALWRKIKAVVLRLPIYAQFYQEKPKHRILMCITRVLLRLHLLPKYQVCVEKLDRLYQKVPYREAETVANFGGAWGMREVMPREIFGKGSYGEFEGITVRLPERVDEYLTHMYGDYMRLPPIEERVGHHYCSVIDLEKPYTEYV